MAANEPTVGNDVKETGRVESFSDGVFSVAITLLILNIVSPTHLLTDSDLLRYLGSQWPAYLAYITSFATIGVMWINHHRLFTHIKLIDVNLMGLNLLLMLIIVAIPFPTGLMAQYLLRTDQHVAAILYNGMNVVLALCFNLLWRYATHENRLLGNKIDTKEVQAIHDQYRFGPLFYLVTMLIAFISAPVSIALDLLLAIFFALPGNRVQSLFRIKQSSKHV